MSLLDPFAQGGGMALLCAGIDANITQLIGPWNSDAMLRYLTVQAEPVMQNFSQCTLLGDYRILPNSTVPMH